MLGHDFKTPKKAYSLVVAGAGITLTIIMVAFVLGQIPTYEKPSYRILLVLVNYDATEEALWRSPEAEYAAAFPFVVAGFNLELDHLYLADSEYKEINNGCIVPSLKVLQSSQRVGEYDGMISLFSPTSNFSPGPHSYAMEMPVEALLNVIRYDHSEPRDDVPSFAFAQIFWHELGHLCGLEHSEYYTDSEHCGTTQDGRQTEKCIMTRTGGNNFYFCPNCRAVLKSQPGGEDVHIVATEAEQNLVYSLFWEPGETKATAKFHLQPNEGCGYEAIKAGIQRPPGMIATLNHALAETLRASPLLVLVVAGLGLIVMASMVTGVSITLAHKKGKSRWRR